MSTTCDGSGLIAFIKIDCIDGHSSIDTQTPTDPSGIEQSLSSKIIENKNFG